MEEDWLQVGNLASGRYGHSQVTVAYPASFCTGQRKISPGSKETATAGPAQDRN